MSAGLSREQPLQFPLHLGRQTPVWAAYASYGSLFHWSDETDKFLAKKGHVFVASYRDK